MKPILFNTDMVRAILDGRKTATRRVVKLPKSIERDLEFREDGSIWWQSDGDGYGDGGRFADLGKCVKYFDLSPYRPGDILYVRETYSPKYYWDGGNRIVYKADWDALSQDAKDLCAKPIWRPSIHMPREAARIFLRVTDVRVERLQDMTEDDVIDEGAEPLIQCPNEHRVYDGSGSLIGMCWNEDCCSGGCNFISKSYGELFGEMVWDSTVKPADREKYGWAANPFCWVIEFERCEKPEDG